MPFQFYVSEDKPKVTISFDPMLTAVIRAPGMDTLKVPLVAERATLDDVSVWEWSGSAYDEGAEAAEWFSTYFGKPARLVRFKEGVQILVFFKRPKMPWIPLYFSRESFLNEIISVTYGEHLFLTF